MSNKLGLPSQLVVCFEFLCTTAETKVFRRRSAGALTAARNIKSVGHYGLLADFSEGGS
jgi:hypothetical protein